MANKQTFQSNHNHLCSCPCHVDWIPKVRRKVPVRDVGVRLKEIAHEGAAELQCDILELEVMPDHDQMLCQVNPPSGMYRFVKGTNRERSRLSGEKWIGSKTTCRGFGQTRMLWRRWVVRHWPSSNRIVRTRKHADMAIRAFQYRRYPTTRQKKALWHIKENPADTCRT